MDNVPYAGARNGVVLTVMAVLLMSLVNKLPVTAVFFKVALMSLPAMMLPQTCGIHAL